MKEPEASTSTLAPPSEAPRVSWRDRTFYLSYWSEKSDEKEVMIGEIMRYLTPQKYFIQTDQGWDNWDLKIARGLWSRAYLLVVTENHGGEKRLMRVRCVMRFSRFSTFVLRAYAVLTAAALILDAPVWAAIIGILGIAHAGLIVYRTVEFGRLMHRIVDTIAQRLHLTPVKSD